MAVPPPGVNECAVILLNQRSTQLNKYFASKGVILLKKRFSVLTSYIGHPHAGQRKADCQLFSLAVCASVLD